MVQNDDVVKHHEDEIEKNIYHNSFHHIRDISKSYILIVFCRLESFRYHFSLNSLTLTTFNHLF